MFIHLFLPKRASAAFCKKKKKNLIFLVVQTSLFCCLKILKIGESYRIIVMYYLDDEHFVVQTVLVFTARCNSSRYFPAAAHEQKSHPYAYFHFEEKGG